jgi:hypothetical protein
MRWTAASGSAGRGYEGAMVRRAPLWMPALALLAAGCGGRDDQPLDGGRPIDFDTGPEMAKSLAADPCARREKGGWHLGIVHCERLLPAERTTGVLVVAFEERSFFPGRTTMPDPNDPLRYTHEIEFDERRLDPAARSVPQGPHGNAYVLTFVGRRMRDPYFVGCDGIAYFTSAVDRLISVRPLGAMAAGRPIDVAETLARPATVERRHGGRWGDRESEAIARCSGRGPRADRLEDVVAEDQTPSQARPPGKASAE